MKTITLTVSAGMEGRTLLAFLKTLDFVTVHEEQDICSDHQASKDCDSVSLEVFISELHKRVDAHFAAHK